MNATRVLADFVSGLKPEKIPPEVLQKAVWLVLDTLGVAVFATQTRWGRIIIDYALKEACQGSSTILGVGDRCFRPGLAALANGTAAHGFELDDVHYPSISHPGSVVVPASLALAEQRESSGLEFLTSVVAGYEVMGRIGACMARTHLKKGFHPTGTFGAFGATAACGRILNLGTESLEHALGLTGSFASGVAQFAETGSMVKRIHAGHAAESGLKAARLAEMGFTGPREILEGKYGFVGVFNQDTAIPGWGRLMADLGERFIIQEISIKPSAACGVLHSVIDCVETMAQERPLEPSMIQEIRVFGHENLVHEHNVKRPGSILAAQYSLPFTVGLAVHGKIEDPRVYLDEAILSDQEILAVADKVHTEMDEEIQSAFPDRFGARVRVTFEDGTWIEHTVMDPPGSVVRPLSEQQLEKKFVNCVRHRFGDAGARRFMEKVLSLPALSTVRHLCF